MQKVALVVIGSGSGNMVIPDELLDGGVAIVECGPFGGTCINRGCIPSKMYSYTADIASAVRNARAFGISADVTAVDWPAIRDRIMSKVDRVSKEDLEGRSADRGVTVYQGHGRVVAPGRVAVDDEIEIEADAIVLATGGRPSVPDVVTSSGVAYETSDTIMRLVSLPDTMAILGGGVVAVEMAHVFSSLGVHITIVEMADVLLSAFDPAIARRFTAAVSDRWELHLGADVSVARQTATGVELDLGDGTRVGAEVLLVATGRTPNTDDLGVEAARGSLDDKGHVVVDSFGRAAPGVWALGDCSSPFELKHVANAEARTIAHNLVHPDDLRPLPHDWVPKAVFSKPQVATVGARGQDLEGRHYVVAEREYEDVAYGWALQDTHGFCRLYADPESGLLLGAHILGDQASLLITPLVQAMAHGQRVMDIARGQYWIHPALSEVVENALLDLGLDQPVASGQAH